MRPGSPLNHDGCEGAKKDERRERELGRLGRLVSDQPDAAVDRGEPEAREGSGEERLPAGPAEDQADAGGELGVSPELLVQVAKVTGPASCYRL